jgi:lysophospholipase L1-like esterase
MLKNKIGKNLALTVLTLAFLWGFFVFGKEVKKRWIVYVTLHSTHWQERYNEMQQVKPGTYRVVFFGNSLTEMFDLTAYFRDPGIYNAGIVGDFTEGLVKRAHCVAKLKPQKVFIEIGINDIIEQISLKKIGDNYRQAIKIIRQQSPATKIYVQSNLPVIINRPSIFTDDARVKKVIIEQNDNLKKMAGEEACVYVDIYSEFLKEKKPETLFIWDGVHLTGKGYAIWSRVVSPYLAAASSE